MIALPIQPIALLSFKNFNPFQTLCLPLTNKCTHKITATECIITNQCFTFTPPLCNLISSILSDFLYLSLLTAQHLLCLRCQVVFHRDLCSSLCSSSITYSTLLLFSFMHLLMTQPSIHLLSFPHNL